jgi:hypothetical protein
MDPKKVATILD